MNRRRTWFDIHLILSVFFLPIALVYAVTGGLNLIGVRAEHHGPRPTAADVEKAPRGGNPSGAGYGRGLGRGATAQGGKPEWAGPRKKPADLYDKIMLLHKGKGGPAFNVVGVAFAVSILVMYISGIVIGWSMPAKRRQMLMSGAIGLVVAITAIAVSL